MAYSSSSFCSILSWSVSPSASFSSMMFSCYVSSVIGVTADASSCGTSVSVISGVASFLSSSCIIKFWNGKLFSISQFVICLSSGLGGLKSISDLCSLALVFSPSQSLLDQSEGTGEGCGASYLQ